MHELFTIILATDFGAGMKSSVAAATHIICGKPVLSYVFDAAAAAGSKSTALVLESRQPGLKELAPENTACIFYDRQSGIADAIMQAKKIQDSPEETVLILFGNTPAITGETLQKAYQYHIAENNRVTIITAQNPQEPNLFQGINSSSYFFQADTFFHNLSLFLDSKEGIPFHLTNVIEKIIQDGQKVESFKIEDSSEIMQVCGQSQMNEAEHVILKRIIEKHMENGVTFHLPETCVIHDGVRIGKNTVIQPGTILEGGTVIGENCVIGPYSRIEDGIVGDGVHFANSVMTQSEIGNNTKVGPFAYIRPGSKIGQNIKIGDFVEIKNSSIGDGTKVPHLSYVGDADVGEGVNLGCGVIFSNYDGREKHRTTVGNNVFVGGNVNLISPVTLKDYSYIAAGSTITDEVPEYALAIARSRQTVIENWVRKKGLDKK